MWESGATVSAFVDAQNGPWSMVHCWSGAGVLLCASSAKAIHLKRMHADGLFCEVTPGGRQKHGNAGTQGMVRCLEQHLQWGYLVASSSAYARPGLVQKGCWDGHAKIQLAVWLLQGHPGGHDRPVKLMMSSNIC